MPPKRMTANPLKPARYRAGKPTGNSSESDSDDEAHEPEQPTTKRTIAPPPKVPSAGRIISSGSNLSKADPDARKKQAAQEQAKKAAAAKQRAEIERKAKEDGFVTEDEDEESEAEVEDDDESEEDDEDEDSSSGEEAPRRLMVRPKFISKAKRNQDLDGDAKPISTTKTAEAEAEVAAESEEARRKAAADAMIEEQIARNLAARAAGKKHWDDEEELGDEVDDTDDVDPEAELAAWKLRELKRIKRTREAIETKEKEREEVERRQTLTEEERRAEDEDHIARQQEEKDARGKMAYMQKYFHKGAFYQDETKEQGLDKRDLMGARFVDDVKNRELLPQALQMRDMTKLGKKGASKYKDLKSEDTGRWGQFDDPRFQRNSDGFDRYGGDDRFRGRAEEGQGANALPLGQRKAPIPDDALKGPREDRSRDEDRQDSYRPGRDDNRRRTRSRSRSPRRHDRDGYRERRRSRSRSARRDDRDDHRERRKRDHSRERDRSGDDKRRRINAR